MKRRIRKTFCFCVKMKNERKVEEVLKRYKFKIIKALAFGEDMAAYWVSGVSAGQGALVAELDSLA